MTYLRSLAEFGMYACPLLTRSSSWQRRIRTAIHISQAVGPDDVLYLPPYDVDRPAAGLIVFEKLIEAVRDRRGYRAAAWLDLSWAMFAMTGIGVGGWAEVGEGFTHRVATDLAHIRAEETVHSLATSIIELFSSRRDRCSWRTHS